MGEFPIIDEAHHMRPGGCDLIALLQDATIGTSRDSAVMRQQMLGRVLRHAASSNAIIFDYTHPGPNPDPSRPYSIRVGDPDSVDREPFIMTYAQFAQMTERPNELTTGDFPRQEGEL